MCSAVSILTLLSEGALCVWGVHKRAVFGESSLFLTFFIVRALSHTRHRRAGRSGAPAGRARARARRARTQGLSLAAGYPGPAPGPDTALEAH